MQMRGTDGEDDGMVAGSSVGSSDLDNRAEHVKESIVARDALPSLDGSVENS